MAKLVKPRRVHVNAIRCYVDGIRKALSPVMLPWIDGPIDLTDDTPTIDLRLLNVGDGDGWRFYRVKTDELERQPTSTKDEFTLGIEMNIRMWSIENNLKPNGSLSLLFQATFRLGRLVERISVLPSTLTNEKRSRGGRNSGKKWKNNPVAVTFARETYGSKIAAGSSQSAAITATRARLESEFHKRPSRSTVRGMVGLSR